MKPSRFGYLEERLRTLRADGLGRHVTPSHVDGPYVVLGGKKRLINLCSNDYLGIPPSGVTDGGGGGGGAANAGANGAQMQSSSRLLCGNDESYSGLEAALARRKSQEAALVFPTGYMANLGVIAAVAGRGDTIYSDRLNHASIIDACRLSGAAVSVYDHNNPEDLGARLGGKTGGRTFVVTEGIFSMDGDRARLDEIVEVAQGHDAIVVVDEAHGDFVDGPGGRGTASRFGSRVAGGIDVYTGSLSKGLGSFGGYAASQAGVIDYMVNASRPFVYTSALPAQMVRHAAARMACDHGPYRAKLGKNTEAMARGLRNAGYDIGGSDTHIIPVIVGGEDMAVRMGRHLASRGVFAQPIRYPTVARGQARIRVSVTAWLDGHHIDAALGAFEDAAGRFGVA